MQLFDQQVLRTFVGLIGAGVVFGLGAFVVVLVADFIRNKIRSAWQNRRDRKRAEWSDRAHRHVGRCLREVAHYFNFRHETVLAMEELSATMLKHGCVGAHDTAKAWEKRVWESTPKCPEPSHGEAGGRLMSVAKAYPDREKFLDKQPGALIGRRVGTKKKK